MTPPRRPVGSWPLGRDPLIAQPSLGGGFQPHDRDLVAVVVSVLTESMDTARTARRSSGDGDCCRHRWTARLDHLAVRKKLARVLEHDHAVAEKVPTLLRVVRDHAGRVVVGSVRRRTRRLMPAHVAPQLATGERVASVSPSRSATGTGFLPGYLPILTVRDNAHIAWRGYVITARNGGSQCRQLRTCGDEAPTSQTFVNRTVQTSMRSRNGVLVQSERIPV